MCVCVSVCVCVCIDGILSASLTCAQEIFLAEVRVRC